MTSQSDRRAWISQRYLYHFFDIKIAGYVHCLASWLRPDRLAIRLAMAIITIVSCWTRDECDTRDTSVLITERCPVSSAIEDGLVPNLPVKVKRPVTKLSQYTTRNRLGRDIHNLIGCHQTGVPCIVRKGSFRKILVNARPLLFPGETEPLELPLSVLRLQ